jgi:hypothetical protein
LKQQTKVTLGVVTALFFALGTIVIYSRSRPETPASASGPCDPSACPKLSCPAGVRTEVGPDGCCPKCAKFEHPKAAERPCTNERCASCPAGTREETIPGLCCPRCVTDDDEACTKGRARYRARYAELEGELRRCSVDEDCAYVSFGDACRATCPLPLNKQKLGTVVARLRDEADSSCGSCAAPAFDCVHRDSASVACVNRRCELTMPDEPPPPPPR